MLHSLNAVLQDARSSGDANYVLVRVLEYQLCATLHSTKAVSTSVPHQGYGQDMLAICLVDVVSVSAKVLEYSGTVVLAMTCTRVQ